MNRPETSIIIRTLNEERHLPKLLDGIHNQSYQNFEVINVDSGSSDRTLEIAESSGVRMLAINPTDFTFGYSLNVGIEAAEGKFVVLISAHTEPCNENWLQKLVDPLRDDNVAMVYGRQYGTDTSKFSESRDLQRTFGPDRQRMVPPNFFANNANSAIARRLWVQRHFDQYLPGQEDIEWAKHWMEFGYTVIYEPDAAIYHIHEETWNQVNRRYHREAVAMRAIGLWGPATSFRLLVMELRCCIADLAACLINRNLMTRFKEIIWFRAIKAYATMSGIFDKTTVKSSLTSNRNNDSDKDYWRQRE